MLFNDLEPPECGTVLSRSLGVGEKTVRRRFDRGEICSVKMGGFITHRIAHLQTVLETKNQGNLRVTALVLVSIGLPPFCDTMRLRLVPL
jgi:hypothetical protein